MISVEEARERILATIEPLPLVEVELTDSLGMALGETAISPNDIPPFDNSAMDGYAVIGGDISAASEENPVELRVLEDLPAGYTAKAAVEAGTAVRIMTGAPMPEGADTVVPVELTGRSEEGVLVMKALKTGANVRYAGEDVKTGQEVLPPGIEIGPAELGMLASLDYKKVKCHRRPVVGVISTGDELVLPGEPLAPGKIRNSNSYTLFGLVAKAGGEPLHIGIVRDRPEELRRTFEEYADRVDAFITSGGVSVGDYDVVKEVLAGLGAMNFWKVAMRPGMPQAFGQVLGKPLFGFPGNPVSVMVSFEVFGYAAIRKLGGFAEISRPEVDAVIDTPMGRKIGRMEFIRVIAEWREGRYHASVTGPQGSGILRSMVLANALAMLPADAGRLEAGAEVRLMLL
jgi:molybdopterin molybdotransferase